MNLNLLGRRPGGDGLLLLTPTLWLLRRMMCIGIQVCLDQQKGIFVPLFLHLEGGTAPFQGKLLPSFST